MGNACCGSTPKNLGDAPKSFPKSVDAYYQFYINWAKNPAFKSPRVLVAYPASANDVLDIVNWANENGYRVRPTGQRHNWSPLTLAPKTVSDPYPGAPAQAAAANTPDDATASATANDDPKIVILDNRKFLNKVLKVDKEKKRVTAQPGMMLGDFCENIEKEGFGVPHTPAPYDITMGGVLSINGHGSAIISAEERKNNAPDNFGTLSNRLVAMTLCVINKDKTAYELKTFTCENDEFPALQTAVGRIMMVDFTLQCIDNYTMRCRSCFDITMKDLCAEPAKDDNGNYIVPAKDSIVGERFPKKSYAHYVDKFGRCEIIWYPFTSEPWLKVWNNVPKNGPGKEYSRFQSESCPFSISDNVPKAATYMIKSALGIKENAADYQLFEKERSELTSTMRKSCCGCITGCCKDCCCPVKRADFSKDTDSDDKDLYGEDSSSLRGVLASGVELLLGFGKDGWGKAELVENFGPVLRRVSEFGLQSEDTWDIWGPSKNTLLYLRTSTARVTANGYAIILPRRKLQLAVWLFYDLYNKMVETFKAQKKYPANMPLEIRVTGLDQPEVVGNKVSPYLSACSPAGVPEEIMNDDPVVLWLDNLSFPGTPSAAEFYAQMEADLVRIFFEGHRWVVRPEWSKGWSYTKDGGAYTSKWFNDRTRNQIPNWNKAIDIFDSLDPKRIFSNSYLDAFMSKINDQGTCAHPAEAEQLKKAEQHPLLPTSEGAADIHLEEKNFDLK